LSRPAVIASRTAASWPWRTLAVNELVNWTSCEASSCSRTMLPKVAKSRRIVRENSELKPSKSQTETAQAMTVQEASRISEANSFVRIWLNQRIFIPCGAGA
jgi:hypothetical protein